MSSADSTTDTPAAGGAAEISDSRRSFLRDGVRGLALLGLGGTAGLLVERGVAEETVWQIDPHRCVQCGKCATHCVKEESAVKAVRSHSMCGYCELCTSYFVPDPNGLNTGAENQVCPTGAIVRKFIEDPYYEYTVKDDLCIGCAKCVEGCELFGNGSMYLQVKHDYCLDCNECSIAIVCPSHAISRIPAKAPYLLKTS